MRMIYNKKMETMRRQDLELADLDLDGRDDIVVATGESGAVTSRCSAKRPMPTPMSRVAAMPIQGA